MSDDVMSVHTAVVAGDLEALRDALGDPDDFPNCITPLAIGDLLIYSVYWGPLTLIEGLIAAGAAVNAEVLDGFPVLNALMTTDRSDRLQVLDVLLAAGADPNARGINDWSALHYAVLQDDIAAADRLLSSGADPHRKTRIDDLSSPMDDAEQRAARGETSRVLELFRSRGEGPADGRT
jgi:hypothetical protein